jgi:hypothetical protein
MVHLARTFNTVGVKRVCRPRRRDEVSRDGVGWTTPSDAEVNATLASTHTIRLYFERSAMWAMRTVSRQTQILRQLSLIAIVFAPVCAIAETEQPRRCVRIDVFAEGQDAATEATLKGVGELAATRDGIVVVRRFPAISESDRNDLHRLAKRHGFDPKHLPVFSFCDVVIARGCEAKELVASIQQALQFTVFTREGCARCTRAKAWLGDVASRYPAFDISTSDIGRDGGARSLLADLVQRHKIAAASVPIFSFGGRLEVGFDRAETTGRRLEAILEGWTYPCPARVDGSDDEPPSPPGAPIELPFLGPVDPATLGMPLFTLVIGLVDGFNPCAMWVLLLLLSVLVNLRDRTRMLAVAGTFVIVSGVAYLAFMAAWLNIFMWIGYLRPVQVLLGLTSLCVGFVHIKDFFAFRSGPTLSIPAAAKPGIYDRMRRIVTAENLPAAVTAAFVLAVLVNIVELLCTAGLPALYTEILSQHRYSPATRYSYLGLYIAAYMFDDMIMVGIAVATLSRFKLQQTGGRWLKLVSGIVILGLGLLLLLQPEWLS